MNHLLKIKGSYYQWDAIQPDRRPPPFWLKRPWQRELEFRKDSFRINKSLLSRTESPGNTIHRGLDSKVDRKLLTAIIILITAFIASFLASVAGFGGSVIMLPVLVWAVGIADAIPILTVAQLIGNLSRVTFNRRGLNWSVIWRFALGAVPTAIIGGIIFAKAPAASLVRVLGVFLILMVVYRHTRWGKNVNLSLRGFVPLGGVSGILSAVLGTVGPLAAPFFLAYGLVKGAYISTEAMTAVVMHITKLGVYGSYSLVGLHTLLVGIGIGAIMILGTFIGSKFLHRVPEHVFPYIIEGTLLISGVIFLVQG